jgi:hypothetical protein
MFSKKAIRREFNDGGWFLTEALGGMLIYLIMLGVIAGMLFALFSGSKQAQMEQAISAMSMKIQSLYAGSASYTGLTNTIAVQSGLVPTKLVRNDAIISPWGGAVTLRAGTDVTTFQIQVDGIEQTDCAQLAAYQLDTFERVEVNGTTISQEQRIQDAAGAFTANNTIIYTAR